LLAMGMVALLGFTAAFWSTWLVQGAHRVDVLVVADLEADTPAANDAVVSLRQAGFRVAAVDTMAPRSTLDRAIGRSELVVVVTPWAPFGAPRAPALELIEARERSDRRPRGSHRVGMIDREGRAFSPERPQIVSWAKHAPSLLGMEQLRVCRERFPERLDGWR